MTDLILPDGVKPEPEETAMGGSSVEPKGDLNEPDPVEITITGPNGTNTVKTPRFLLVYVAEAEAPEQQETLQISFNLTPQEVHAVIQSLSQKLAMAMAQNQPKIVPASMGVHPNLLNKLTNGKGNRR